ncbi:hypothetical protein FISHEDRAFT_35149, partial [Fistulina hepatica ATCC 64428]
EQDGWKNVPDGDVMADIIAHVCARTANTQILLVSTKGRARRGVEAAGQLAKDVLAVNVSPSEPAKEPLRGFTTNGVSLHGITQVKAYKALRAQSKQPERPTTVTTVEEVQEAARKRTGKTPRVEQLWASVTHKDFNRSFQFFLWRVMHGSYKVGRYWSHIPGYEERAMCPECNETETMEHIIFRCRASGQTEIWHLAANLWKNKAGEALPITSLGDILASGLSSFAKKSDGGAKCLLRITIAESVKLIWRLRCAHRMGT